MNGVLRFHTLRWIRINSGSVSGCEVEEFIDTTRNYHKTIWSDGYTEIVPVHAIHTGQTIKEPKTLLGLSVYKSPKICYNIYVKQNKESEITQMKKIKYYTVEEAKAIIAADKKLKAGLEKLRPEYEDEENRMDYGLDYCDFFADWDSDEDVIPICVCWENDEDEQCISVSTLEQAILIVRDIEEAQGNIEP